MSDTPTPRLRQTKADLMREVITLRAKVDELNAIAQAKQRALEVALLVRSEAWDAQARTHLQHLTTLRKLRLTAVIAGLLCGGYLVIGLALLTSPMGGGQ